MNDNDEFGGAAGGLGLPVTLQPAPTQAPEGVHENPKEGGCYSRDPATGALVKIEGPQDFQVSINKE